jgi:rsbT co-antagonist protein RsbR
MREQILYVRADTIELQTRGRLLKGAAGLMALGVLLSLPLVLTTPGVPLVSLLSLAATVALAAIVFGLAHYGYVTSGAVLLLVGMEVTFAISTPPENIVNGQVALVFVLYMLVAGLVIGASSVLIVGAAAIAEILAFSQIAGVPPDAWTFTNITLILIAAGLLWLIINTQAGWLTYARAQAQAASIAQQDLAEREQALVAANQELRASNAHMESLLSLVRDLETPAIPLLQGVLLVPLVGQLDTHRAARITQAVLDAVVQQRAEVVIIDITGISAVDTSIVRRIERLARSVQLLGARTMLTGVSAAVAQTIAQQELDFSEIRTVGRLQDGVAAVLNEMGRRAM